MKNAHVVAVAAGLAAGALFIHTDICQDAWLRYGIGVETCPDGKVRQTAQLAVAGLRRGAKGSVTFGATAHYTTSASDHVISVPVDEIGPIKLSLIGRDKKVTPIAVERWSRHGSERRALITLPEVPDGDYQLHATFRTRIGPGELDVPLPLYTPARIHVLTDRPLYEPGNTVQFRAVVLRARDLAPIDGRPGTWVIKDPNGELLLEEKAPAGEWGVVSGSFPLDKGAQTGSWRVAWTSAEATDEVAFTVEPFTLPRFSVESTASKSFYRPGETPVVRGAVTYSSGAPVANATLDITWNVNGAWPPPREWLEKLLPKRAATAANGRFELALPKIPEDLQGQATMTARISAIDPAGDRVEGSATVLLSQDGIQVSAVTELGDGLVQGFNNKLFVRVTTPDGGVVANAKVIVKRAWQPNDAGITAALDEDGVAALQLDPGPPVNVVIPALPWRQVARPQLVTRGEVADLINEDGASLADQVEIDRWLAVLSPCAKWIADEDTSARVGLRIDAGGRVVAAGGGASALDQCVVGTLRSKRLPARAERMYTLTFNFTDPQLSRLSASVESALDEPEGLQASLDELARGTRDCLPQVEGAEGSLPDALTWRVTAGSKLVELGTWIKDPQGGAARVAMPCVSSRIHAGRRIELAEKADADSLGIVRFTVSLPETLTQAKPQPTTMLGYELAVSADIEGTPSTKLRVSPGEVPNLRLRVTPVIAKPGETITAELIRGPDFAGSLPDKLEVVHLKGTQEPKLDSNRKTTFKLDANTSGWVEVRGGGVRALVYVKPDADLEVAVTPKQPRYAPGQKAELAIETRLAGKGGRAAVGLFGVDQSLGQLVPLPGPAELSRLQPKVETGAPAFGTLDGQALALGRIRGANAAAATVLRVTTIPSPPELDAVVHAAATSRFDAIEELTDRFYVVLAELHLQTRQWEAKAPPDAKMQPAVMAELWKQALAACTKRGAQVTDAYGRTLRLSRLPPDLLSLTDPRAVVVVGTRLPEDVENWAAWVARERP